MADTPYELWETHQFLGILKETKPEPLYWLSLFLNQMNSEDEWIDFAKLPLGDRIVAPLVMPLARGKAIYKAAEKAFRFKPAYTKLDDPVDVLMGLRRVAGVDTPMLGAQKLTVMERRELIKAQIAIMHIQAIYRHWNWQAAKAAIDGKITLTGEDYPTTLVDFQRDAGQTEILGAGERYGDSGVSIFDHFQKVIDTMSDAEYGGAPVQARFGANVWAKMRVDTEFLSHMDKNKEGNAAKIERGLISGSKTVKVGEMQIGGQSGAVLELILDKEDYKDPVTGATTKYIDSDDIVFTGTAEDLQGYRCFGRIIDQDAEYEPLDLFQKNYEERKGDLLTENVSSKSAPLMVPINPNTTYKATVTNG